MDARENVVHYKEHFNPEVYLGKYYGSDHSTMFAEVLSFLDVLNEIFTSGMLTGKRLLDVGTGPSISSIIAASRHFDEIYLSDITPNNLIFLNEWWTARKFPLDHVIKYCLDIEHSSETVAERNKEIRNKVKGILTIDVQKSNPLFPNRFAVFDAIVSAFCLETASGSRGEYKIAVYNVASLLKKNGKLVILGMLDLATYTVGDAAFPRIALSEKDIRDIYTEKGFEIEFLKVFKCNNEPVICDTFAWLPAK